MIDLLVFMIPDREFYYPEINQGELSDYQKDILISFNLAIVVSMKLRKNMKINFNS